jgi:hypothetical protein
LTSSFWLQSARLGNRLFAFISIYGIARQIDRLPYVTSPNKAIQNLTDIFPNMKNIYTIVNNQNITEQSVQFGDSPYIYESPARLEKYANVSYLVLSGIYFQCWPYFHRYRMNILQMLAFNSSDILESANISQIFVNDSNPKLCVHIRREDFVTDVAYEPSTELFTLESIRFVRQKLLMDNNITLSVILFGSDREWIEDIVNKTDIIYYILPKPSRPSVHLAIASQHCDIVLLTATGSTYGFWLAYLSKNVKHVYYNSKRFKNSKRLQDTKKLIRQYMLPNYIALRLNESTNTIEIVRYRSLKI